MRSSPVVSMVPCGPRAVKDVLFLLAWVLITLAAGYDILFAWHYRAWFARWELNPVACWIAAVFGFEALLVFKAAATVFTAGLALYCHRRRPRLEMPLTWIIGVAYLLLSLHYVAGHVQAARGRALPVVTPQHGPEHDHERDEAHEAGNHPVQEAGGGTARGRRILHGRPSPLRRIEIT